MADDSYPDLNEIEGQLKDEWSERDTMIEEMREIRFMENSVSLPKSIDPEVVRSPIGHQIIERMTGTLTADPPSVTIPPASEKKKHLEQSSLMEKFTLPALDQLERQTDEDVSDRFVESLIADGHGCMRMLYAPQLWHGMPRQDDGEGDEDYNERVEEWKRGQRKLPIHWTWCDPLTIYPMWSEFGLYGILEVDERSPLTLDQSRWTVTDRPELDELMRTKGQGVTPGKVKFQQWWTPDTITYGVNGQVVHHQTHKYGVPPYAYAFGLGASSYEPKRMGYSVLYPVRYLLPYLDRLLSQKGTAIRIWCWPTPIFRQTSLAQQLGQGGDEATDQEGEVPLRRFRLVPGQPVTLYQDEEVTFLTWQGNGPDADEMVRLVQSMIEKAGLADTLYGQSSGDSGYAINQLIAAARMRWKPIVAHADRAMELMIARMYDIIEFQIGQVVHVYAHGEKRGWVSLGPDDLQGYRQIKVKLNPILPTDEYAISSRMLNEVRGGLRAPDTAMEKIGIAQPDEEMRKIRVARWMMRPEVEEFLTQEALRRAGIRMAEQGLTPGRMQKGYEAAPQALKNVMNRMAQQGALPSGNGGAPQMQRAAPPQMQGQPQQLGQPMQGRLPQGMMAQAQGQGQGGVSSAVQRILSMLPPQAAQVLVMLAQRMGIPIEQLIMQLYQMAQRYGVPFQQMLMMFLQQMMAGMRGGQPGRAQGAGMGAGRMGQTPRQGGPAVMAGPGVRAVPQQPYGGGPRVGRRVMPAGVATGRAPGVRRQGSER